MWKHADTGRCCPDVGAAAELGRPALAHVHHPNGVAVLLSEEGDGAPLLGLIDGQRLHGDGCHSPPKMASFTRRSDLGASSSGVRAEKWVKSKRSRSGILTREPACCTWAAQQRSAGQPVQQVGGGVVARWTALRQPLSSTGGGQTASPTFSAAAIQHCR